MLQKPRCLADNGVFLRLLPLLLRLDVFLNCTAFETGVTGDLSVAAVTTVEETAVARQQRLGIGGAGIYPGMSRSRSPGATAALSPR